MSASGSLAHVSGLVEREAETARRGVVLLALDGVSRGVAGETLTHARLSTLRSTFPSTSTTAWLTAVTGRDVDEHGAVGMVYRAPGSDAVTHLATGARTGFGACPASPDEGPLLRPRPTLFDRAAHRGAEVRAICPELTALKGAWSAAVLHGARVVPCPSATPQPTEATAVAASAARRAGAVLAEERERPLLLWVYVNLDDHIHRHGYDGALRRALRELDETASRWADAGWTVIAHADHGQTPVRDDPDLRRHWERLDGPTRCRVPGGGAGRVRWLYPLPGHAARLADELRDRLDGHALVLTPDELDERGLVTLSSVVRARIGEVVAVATSPRFPVPDPAYAYEHGSITDDEVLVPYAVWGEPHGTHSDT